MKASRAILEALAKAEREGRVASTVAVNPTALGHPTLGIVEGENEAAFQQRLITFARSRGWGKIAHFRPARVMRRGKETYETPIAEDGKGFVDLVLLRERLVVIEAKVKKRKRSKWQLEWAEALQRAGVEYYCFYPKDREEIERVLW